MWVKSLGARGLRRTRTKTPNVVSYNGNKNSTKFETKFPTKLETKFLAEFETEFETTWPLTAAGCGFTASAG
jgi:hypothetical protein